MYIINIEEYLSFHEKRHIGNGMSGAEVWDIEGEKAVRSGKSMRRCG